MNSCLICQSLIYDYSSHYQCMYCRTPVLVCGNCQGKIVSAYVCEFCQKCAGNVLALSKESGNASLGSVSYGSRHANVTSSLETHWNNGASPSRKLRILCLHGFRQNASSFKGRTASLAKKLRNIVEFVFVDAPHQLNYVYQPRIAKQEFMSTVCAKSTHPPPAEKCKKRFAWLVAQTNNPCHTDWSMVDVSFDSLQYQQQKEGFAESCIFLRKVIAEMGNFDGVLGFSQGAAMAAAFLWVMREKDDVSFKFAILCSGFVLDSLCLSQGRINCCSLHIFGNEESDRQIPRSMSMELVNSFKEGSSTIIEHNSGHMIPTRSPYIDQIKAFLWRFIWQNITRGAKIRRWNLHQIG